MAVGAGALEEAFHLRKPVPQGGGSKVASPTKERRHSEDCCAAGENVNHPSSAHGKDPLLGREEVRPVLVLGLGNPLVGDDGVGAAVLEALETHYLIPPALHLVDGGTMGLYLIDRVSRYERLLVVDCVDLEEPPGTVVRIEGEDVISAFRTRISPHVEGVNDLLTALTLMGKRPKEVVVVGMVPRRLEVGVGLSEEVRRGLKKMLDLVRSILAQWGVPLGERRGIA